MSLYSILLFCTFLVPFTLSFDNKLQFYKQWKYLSPSIIIVAFFYIVSDIYFTKHGIWGFNPRYHSSIVIYRLPIEEWLFFIVIPYASIFLHDSILLYFSNTHLSHNFSKYLSIGLLLISIILVLFNLEKAYTAYIFSLVILVVIFTFFDKTNVISSFYCTFLLILVPFLIVNAILTGSFIDEPIVWYDNSENLGIRFFTIPFEDFGYAFSLILFNLVLRNKLKKFGDGFKQV